MLRRGRRTAGSRQPSVIGNEGKIPTSQERDVGHPVEFPRCKYKINIPSISSTDVFGPGFEILFDLGHELVGDGAVNQAVVVTEGKVNDGSDGDGVVALFVGDDERHF